VYPIDGWTQTAASDTLLGIIPADEIFNALNEAPFREGPPPDTPIGIPHQQFNQNAPVTMQEALRALASALPGIKFEPTPFSLSGSVGWRLDESFAQGPAEAFIPQSLEFGHQHVPSDGSMHLLLPLAVAKVALEKGWGVIHPLTDSISGENDPIRDLGLGQKHITLNHTLLSLPRSPYKGHQPYPGRPCSKRE